MLTPPLHTTLGAELVFVGTGEALDPTLPNTSLLVRGPQTLLLDCGYSVPHALWRITRDVEELDAIWISHVHADHAFGLPALLLWMRLGGRSKPLTLLCGPGQAAKLEQVLELGYPGSFAASKCYPIELRELDGDGPHWIGPRRALDSFGPARDSLEGFTLRTAASRHSVPNCALRLEAPGLRSLVYSGDGAPTPATAALCEGASLLIHECFFVTAGEQGPAKHGDLDGCLALAKAAGVGALALLHFAAEAKLEIIEAARAKAAGFELLLPSPGDRVSLAARTTPSPGAGNPV